MTSPLTAPAQLEEHPGALEASQEVPGESPGSSPASASQLLQTSTSSFPGELPSSPGMGEEPPVGTAPGTLQAEGAANSGLLHHGRARAAEKRGRSVLKKASLPEPTEQDAQPPGWVEIHNWEVMVRF